MQCEGFKPGCTNEAGYTIKGYTFCLACFREFAGYSPGEEHRLVETTYKAALISITNYPLADVLTNDDLRGIVAELQGIAASALGSRNKGD